jgi:hypothetical protein
MKRILTIDRFSRRNFLQMAGAMTLYSGLSGPATAAAKFKRKNLEDGSAANDLASYKLAVEAMLKLPPDDPRNWYRMAVTHLIDCPHGNWWFFPWHRAYLGWFERTCRELSGDANFAMPYWDWTATPRIPAALFGNVLDPTTGSFLKDKSEFEAAYKPAISKLWDDTTSAQRLVLARRGYNKFDDIWNQLMANFVPRSQGRTLTESNPKLPTPDAVKLSVIDAGLAPKKYVATGATGFSAPEAPNHSIGSGDAIIEGLPHNMVHNDIGGNMPTFLSPIDPIFYLHHCNIDRLWDVWATVNKDTPTDALFKDEAFLFFVDEKGKPVTEVKTSHYVSIGAFDYDYQPGSGTASLVILAAGEEAIPSPRSASGKAGFTMDEAGTLVVPLVDNGKLLATPPIYDVMVISFQPPAHNAAAGVRFNVYLSPSELPSDLSVRADHYVNSVSLFGHSTDHSASPVSFTIPIREALERMAERGELGDKLSVSIIAEEIHAGTVTNRKLVTGQLLSVTFSNF